MTVVKYIYDCRNTLRNLENFTLNTRTNDIFLKENSNNNKHVEHNLKNQVVNE